MSLKNTNESYREFNVNYKKYNTDLEPVDEAINSNLLIDRSKIFFKKNGLLLNWKEFETLDESQKINTLAMIAPVTNEEKQKLLESITLTVKNNSLLDIMNFYLHEGNFNNRTVQ